MECIKGKPINKCSQSREKEQTPRIDLLDTGERQPAGLRKESGEEISDMATDGFTGFLGCVGAYSAWAQLQKWEGGKEKTGLGRISTW